MIDIGDFCLLLIYPYFPADMNNNNILHNLSRGTHYSYSYHIKRLYCFYHKKIKITLIIVILFVRK